jgi:uncharacterized phiE125 gp8 family phage protein
MRSLVRVITAPTTEPISLPEAKSHLRVDFIDDDAYISGLISAARVYAEGFQGRSLAPTTLELIQDTFSSSIKLRRGPVNSVTSITYTRADGTVVTLPTTDYIVKADGDIITAYHKFWPVDELVPGDAVKVTYQAGYTSAPQSTKQALLLLIGHWYENREAVVVGKEPKELPLAVNALLWMDRSW